MPARRLAVALFVGSVIAGFPALADNWPAWRGPAGTGVTDEPNAPIHWSATENVRWRVPLPAEGNSSPIVWGDRVFITSGVEEGHARAVLCFNRADGSLLWQQAVEYGGDEPSHRDNPPCSATPATDGAHVVAWHGSAGVVCYDMQGNQLWHRDLGEFRHIFGNASSVALCDDLVILYCGPGNPSYVTALSLETGETVWQHDEESTGGGFGPGGFGPGFGPGGQPGGRPGVGGRPGFGGRPGPADAPRPREEADEATDQPPDEPRDEAQTDRPDGLDRSDGQAPEHDEGDPAPPRPGERPRFGERPGFGGGFGGQGGRGGFGGRGFGGMGGGFGGTWSTPLVVHAAGTAQVIVSLPNILKAYDARTGDELWRCEGLGGTVYPSPIVSGDLVVASSGRGASIAVRLGGEGDVTATHRVWQYPSRDQQLGSGVIHEGHLYVLTEAAVIQCIDLETGELVSRERLGGESSWSSLVLAGDRLYANDMMGNTYVFTASPELQLLAENPIGEMTRASLAISDGQVFIRTYEHLYCIEDAE